MASAVLEAVEGLLDREHYHVLLAVYPSSDAAIADFRDTDPYAKLMREIRGIAAPVRKSKQIRDDLSIRTHLVYSYNERKALLQRGMVYSRRLVYAKKVNDEIGMGLFALTDIPAYTYLIEYTGEYVRTLKEMRAREAQYEAEGLGSYIVVARSPSGAFYFAVDATKPEMAGDNNLARLMNHSRKHPNVEIKAFKVFEESKPHIMMFAKNKPIKKDEQLLFDYGDVDPEIPWLAET
jgi:hypothetical protein